MDSPTGIMPEDLLFREKRREAKAWIIAQPWPADNKRSMLFAWARTVAVRLTRNEVEAVTSTGIDVAQPGGKG